MMTRWLTVLFAFSSTVIAQEPAELICEKWTEDLNVPDPAAISLDD